MAHIDPSCRGIAAKAANGKLSEADIIDAFEKIDQHKNRLEAEGKGTGKAERVKKWAAEEGERAKIAAAMRRRHAGLNAIVRDRIDRQIKGMIDGGLKPHQAVRAVMEGINSHTAGSRASVAAATQAYQARYVKAMFAELEAERPHLVHLLNDKKLDEDVLIEMWETRKGGNPGSTGNADAKFLAETFAKYAELSRTELNRLGASIGKLDGWAGVQTHDPIPMLKAGKEVWVGRIVPLLDIERTFPEGVTQAEAREILGDIYDTIITGVQKHAGAVERGQRVNPANLAKSLGKSRVLHFADAKAALSYREQFGYGNTISGMFSHLSNMAKKAGAMETLGPNPEIMITAIAAKMQRDIRDSATLSDKDKISQIGKLKTEGGALRHAIDVMVGTVSRPVDVNAAQIGASIRIIQQMAKLGAVLFSSINDTTTAGIAAQFRGSNFFTSTVDQIGGVMRGRPRGEQGIISYLLGEGVDGMLGHIQSIGYATDGAVGALGKIQAGFFKWNGLTWWTDVNRSVAARTIAAEMGMHASTAFENLPAKFRHVLEQADIHATDWEALGKVALRMDNGKPYLTPDRVRELSDEDIMPLAAERIQAIRDAAEKAGPNSRAAQTAEERIAGIIMDERRRLEVKMLAYVADQTSFAVLEGDARSRRYTTQGTRPGTMAGEVTRMLMQFKAFPMAFTTRTFGRAIFGHRKDASMMERTAHIGQLIAGLTIAGYMSMVAKDLLKGYWPPRNPGDYRTVLAALQQGGAWGIYGDFLFSDVNRFGSGVLETVAGPTIGSVADLVNISLQGRNALLSGGEDDISGGKLFSTIVSNTPYANLHLLKPALDYMVLNSIREAISPGYMRKLERQREKEYGQKRIPQLIGAAPAMDPFNIASGF